MHALVDQWLDRFVYTEKVVRSNRARSKIIAFASLIA